MQFKMQVYIFFIFKKYIFNKFLIIKGGLAYDMVLANHFAEEIDNKPERKGKESIKKNRRTMVKLLKECKSLKEILSANKES